MPNDYVDNKGSEKSMGVHASNIENSDSKIEDYPLRPSEMKGDLIISETLQNQHNES